MIDPDARLRRRPGLLTQCVDDTWVVLDPEDGNYYALDEVSGRIWELCDGTRTTAEVVAAICGEFDAPPETITADVMDFLSELCASELLAAEESAESP
jgi:coenzyme PQQ biosynthesis protein PqqD